jgi:hypothetical protein
MSFLERIQESIDRGINAIGKFFCVINHDILLDKLNSNGMRDKTKLWFKS